MRKFKHNPVKYPVLRTARLASVRSAMFGMVRNNGTRAHQGVDLAIGINHRIYAVEDGTVVQVRNQGDHGISLTIRMETSNPNLNGLFAFYSHLNRVDVKVGDKVKAGQIIGLTGNTGNARDMTTIEKGAHLHFEIRTQLSVGLGLAGRIDPLPFIELV
jgi:murein DD-endopeptidase MepM/ murein hydrolase activator NlpD